MKDIAAEFQSENICKCCGKKIKIGEGIVVSGSFFDIRGKLQELDNEEIHIRHVRGTARNNMATRRDQAKAMKNLINRRNKK